jgi:dihydroxyacetone kinase-like protein
MLLTMAKEIGETPSDVSVRKAFSAAFEAVKARGKSDVGQKTLLDVMAPVLDIWTGESPNLAAMISKQAQDAADATIPMKAIRGRASFLGDRSIGHMDPGARSLSLLIATIAKRFGA